MDRLLYMLEHCLLLWHNPTMLAHIPDDIISGYVYAFTSLQDHHSLAITCKLLYKLGWTGNTTPWDKRVVVKGSSQLDGLSRIGRPSQLCVGNSENMLEPQWDIQNTHLLKLAHMPLRSLKLINCVNVTDVPPLSSFSQLTYLNVHKSKVDDNMLARLVNVPNLLYLNVSSTNVTDSGLYYLRFLHLNYLSLNNCRVNGSGLVHLNTTLKHLDVKKCLITNGDRISRFTGLTYLNVSQTGIPHFEFLRVFQSLTELHIAETDITNHDMRVLVSLPLVHLNVSWCNQIGLFGILHIAKLTHLKSLNLRSTYGLTDAGLYVLAELHLDEIDVSFCDNITQKGLDQLPEHIHKHTIWCKMLEEANHGDCTQSDCCSWIHATGP